MKLTRKLMALLASVCFVCYVAIDPLKPKVPDSSRYYNTPLWYMLYGAILVLLLQQIIKTHLLMKRRIK